MEEVQLLKPSLIPSLPRDVYIGESESFLLSFCLPLPPLQLSVHSGWSQLLDLYYWPMKVRPGGTAEKEVGCQQAWKETGGAGIVQRTQALGVFYYCFWI
jgi:hypothetical protein